MKKSKWAVYNAVTERIIKRFARKTDADAFARRRRRTGTEDLFLEEGTNILVLSGPTLHTILEERKIK